MCIYNDNNRNIDRTHLALLLSIRQMILQLFIDIRYTYISYQAGDKTDQSLRFARIWCGENTDILD